MIISAGEIRSAMYDMTSTARAASMVASIIRRRLSSMRIVMEWSEAALPRIAGRSGSARSGGGATSWMRRRHVGHRPSLESHSSTQLLWKV